MPILIRGSGGAGGGYKIAPCVRIDNTNSSFPTFVFEAADVVSEVVGICVSMYLDTDVTVGMLIYKYAATHSDDGGYYEPGQPISIVASAYSSYDASLVSYGGVQGIGTKTITIRPKITEISESDGVYALDGYCIYK